VRDLNPWKVVGEGRKQGWWERRRRKRKMRRRWKGRRINFCEFWRGGNPWALPLYVKPCMDLCNYNCIF